MSKSLKFSPEDIRKMIVVESFRNYINNKPLSRDIQDRCREIILEIKADYYDNMLLQEEEDYSDHPVAQGIAALGTEVADGIRGLQATGVHRLFGDAFLNTIRANVAEFLLSAIGIPSGGALGLDIRNAIAVGLGSIKMSEWPDLIDNWQPPGEGCIIVSDAIVRGIVISFSKTATSATIEMLSKVPLIGSDLAALKNEGMLMDIIRQMSGDVTIDNIPGLIPIRDKIRDQLCDIDPKNLDLGQVEAIKAALLSWAAMAGGLFGAGTERARDAAGELLGGEEDEMSDDPGYNDPDEFADDPGYQSRSEDTSIDDIIGDASEKYSEYSQDWWTKLREIAEETLPELTR